MKVSLKKVLVGGLAIGIAGIALVAGSGSSTTSATSFNGTVTGNFRYNASMEIGCNGPHPTRGTESDHNGCIDTFPAGGPNNIDIRSRNEVEDGSMLATGVQQQQWTSGGLAPVCVADGTIIGTVASDVDLLRDGNLDQLPPTAITRDATPPGFVSIVFPTPPSYDALPSCYYRADITFILLGATATVVPLPNPVTLSILSLNPDFVGGTTSVSVAFLGGDPNPPSSPLLTIQNPQRATTNITAAGGSQQQTSGTNIVTWSLATGGEDVKDGFSQAGPTGGTHEASGTAVPAGVLRNVQCFDNGGPACPVGAALWTDGDTDGLPDIIEGPAAFGSSATDPDTDNDGVTDFEEMLLLTDPTAKDSDGDGIVGLNGTRTDGNDNCPNNNQGTSQLDSDGDAIGDACDTDDDNDGLLDLAETQGYYMGWTDVDAFTTPGAVNPGEPGWNCRPSTDLGALPGATLAPPVIQSNPLDADTDDDGIEDGRECELGSAPYNSNASPAGAGPPAYNNAGAPGTLFYVGVCVRDQAPPGPPFGITDCPFGPVAGGFGTAVPIGPADLSRPELKGNGGADDDNDGNGVDGDFASANFDDADADGLPNWAEAAYATSCSHLANAGGAPPTNYPSISTCLFNPRFNSDFDSDGSPGLLDMNSDGELGCPSPGWTAAAGYPIPAASAGCDGPDAFSGRSPAQRNEDGDGIIVTIKSSAAGTLAPEVFRGSAALLSFGGATGFGGCAAAEEAALPVNPGSPLVKVDTNPRDFLDVNNSGNVNGTDVALVTGSVGGVAGDPASNKYRRTLDLNASAAAGGKGSGNINGTDVAIVTGQVGFTCLVDDANPGGLPAD